MVEVWVMRFSNSRSMEVAAVSGKGPLVCAAVSSTQHPHLGTFEDTGTSENYPSPCPNRPPACGLHWGPPQGAFLHGMGSRARKKASHRGQGAMWWVVCGRGLLMWGVTMSEIDAIWAVGTVGIGQSEHACAMSGEGMVSLMCTAESVDPCCESRSCHRPRLPSACRRPPPLQIAARPCALQGSRQYRLVLGRLRVGIETQKNAR